MDKQQLEERIQTTASEIFSLAESAPLDKSEDFKSLKTKLAADIWKWCVAVFGSKRTGKAGVEIMECINRSLSSFTGEATEYMHYIAATLKNEIRRATGKAANEERHLIRLPDKKRQEIKQFLHFAECCGKDITSTEVQRMFAKECRCTDKEISALVQYYARSSVQSDTIVSDDGEDWSLLDASPELMTEETVICKIELERRLVKIDEIFATAQERTKPYLSALITHLLLVELKKAKADTDDAVALLLASSFAKTRHAQKIIAEYQKDGTLCLEKDIAKSFDRGKTSASRTLKNFLEKVSTCIKSEYNNM